MAQMTPRPGRHITRRLEEPRLPMPATCEPGGLAAVFAAAHNEAVRTYGSDSGGFHAFDPAAGSAGVWDSIGGFPHGCVVTRLSWGRIDLGFAQRLLEGDGIRDKTTEG